MIDIKPFLLRFKTEPLAHQILGAQKIASHKYFALFDEQGLGKTKEVIDGCCILFEQGQLRLVIVLTPASVRQSWLDPDFGEIQKHTWVPNYVTYEFHSKGLVRIFETTPEKPRLAFVVTNYEYLIREDNLKILQDYARKNQTALICDESSFIKSSKAKRTKAAFKLRDYCDYCFLLNGTPQSGRSPIDLFAQSKIMSPTILGIRTKTEFMNKYCRMGGITGYLPVGPNPETIKDLQDRMAPFVLRRKKDDCLDLPAKRYKTHRIPLSHKSWALYKQLRDDALATLEDGSIVMTPLAITKIARLAQITSGLLGGVQDTTEDGEVLPEKRMEIIGHEKVDFTEQFVRDALEGDNDYRILVWSKFRKERELIVARLDKLMPVYQIYGGQNQGERDRAVREFSTGKERACLVGQQQSGGFGLNFVTCHNVLYMSNTYSMIDRKQSEDRNHRMGQKNHVIYNDLVACGPNGQYTVDMGVVKALQEKEEMAEWTTSRWRQVLTMTG